MLNIYSEYLNPLGWIMDMYGTGTHRDLGVSSSTSVVYYQQIYIGSFSAL